MGLAGTTINQALIARIGASHAGLRRELNAATQTVRQAGTRMRSAFRVASQAAAAVTAVVVGIGAAALKMASDFESAMAEVSTLLDVSLGEMGDLTAAVKGLSLEFGVKLTEQARALYQTISAGATDAADATRILEVANKAAVAGISGVAISVEAIMRVVNAYSLSSSEAMRVSDLLFQTVRKGVTTFAELAPTIGQVAGTAATAGIQLEELFAIIATATKIMPIEQVITGTNQLFLSLISRTEQSEEAARALGIQWDASALAAKGMRGVLGDLVRAMGISIEELQRIVNTGADTEAAFAGIANRTGVTSEVISALFPNVRALRVALAVLKNGGRDLDEQLANMNRAAGATDTAYQKMAATFGFLAASVKQEVAVAFVELGETLFPVAREIVSMIGGIARKVREWVSVNQELLNQRVEQVFVAIVRGAGKALEILVATVDFFRRNPLAGEFGIVGLVFLGPAGAAVFTFIGRALDWLAAELWGATTVAGKLQQNIDEATAKMRALFMEKARGQLTAERLAEINAELVKLSGIVEMNRRTLETLGPEAEGVFEGILADFRKLADAMQAFDFGDFAKAFGGGGEPAGETPISRAASDVAKMRFELAQIPALTGEVSAQLDIATGRAARLRLEAGDRLRASVEEVGETLVQRIGHVLTDLVTGTMELAEAMKRLGQMILQEVVSALIKAALYAAILKPLLASFGVPFFQHGGVVPAPAAQQGMVLPPFAPPGFGGAIPALLHPGEAVLTKRVVDAWPRGTITAINRGDRPSNLPPQLQRQPDIHFHFEDVPDPLDYGILASKPQMRRFMAEALRRARFTGGRGD